jgi:hypothetical protein
MDKTTLVHNFHVAGEGKCTLDRFFGSLAKKEKTFLYSQRDITSMLFKH